MSGRRLTPPGGRSDFLRHRGHVTVGGAYSRYLQTGKQRHPKQFLNGNVNGRWASLWTNGPPGPLASYVLKFVCRTGAAASGKLPGKLSRQVNVRHTCYRLQRLFINFVLQTLRYGREVCICVVKVYVRCVHSVLFRRHCRQSRVAANNLLASLKQCNTNKLAIGTASLAPPPHNVQCLFHTRSPDGSSITGLTESVRQFQRFTMIWNLDQFNTKCNDMMVK